MTRNVEFSVHKGQNLQHDNLWKSGAQVDIEQKSLLIKSSPVAFLLIGSHCKRLTSFVILHLRWGNYSLVVIY